MVSEKENRKNRAAFTKKKVQQTGNLAKNAVGGAVRGIGGALKANAADSKAVEGQESGQLSGGSRYIDRAKQS